ncbi:MAG: hypothetical protein HC929_06340 [Leptolyngbyaceae cyanobacterium SM2_5_2]|nr:hypothetical protein [Leptolyngbyaceae cyanobacterium SM2_5_2]
MATAETAKAATVEPATRPAFLNNLVICISNIKNRLLGKRETDADPDSVTILGEATEFLEDKPRDVHGSFTQKQKSSQRPKARELTHGRCDKRLFWYRNQNV